METKKLRNAFICYLLIFIFFDILINNLGLTRLLSFIISSVLSLVLFIFLIFFKLKINANNIYKKYLKNFENYKIIHKDRYKSSFKSNNKKKVENQSVVIKEQGDAIIRTGNLMIKSIFLDRKRKREVEKIIKKVKKLMNNFQYRKELD